GVSVGERRAAGGAVELIDHAALDVDHVAGLQVIEGATRDGRVEEEHARVGATAGLLHEHVARAVPEAVDRGHDAAPDRHRSADRGGGACGGWVVVDRRIVARGPVGTAVTAADVGVDVVIPPAAPAATDPHERNDQGGHETKPTHRDLQSLNKRNPGSSTGV